MHSNRFVISRFIYFYKKAVVLPSSAPDSSGNPHAVRLERIAGNGAHIIQ